MFAQESFHVASPAPYVDELNPRTAELWRYYRTEIERADQLTNGQAWIQTFEHVLQTLPRPRRQLAVSISDCGDPRHTLPAFGPKQRNDAAKAMREPQVTPSLPEGARHGVGKQIKLPSGDQVLILCNVGAQAPKQLPRKFRDMPLEELALIAVAAKCPHMGACLNEGELKDVEDIATPGGRRAIIRCPWHNMQFDLQTGEGVGNHSHLPRYPVRVALGALYVGVRLPQGAPTHDTSAMVPLEEAMDVDMEDGGAQEVRVSELGCGGATATPFAVQVAAAQEQAPGAPGERSRSRTPRPPPSRLSPNRTLRQTSTIC